MAELHANLRDGRRLVDARHPEPAGTTWRFAVAGLCASLVGLGLARFAYTPLIPALIAANWFSASDVVYLGAANLAGYLAGALLAHAIAARIGAVRALRAMMLLATISCFASTVPISFVWFFAWRFASGVAGAVIMVLAASVVLPHTSPAKRGLVGGVIFAGVGLGIAISGTLVPLLLQQGLRESWIGLGALSLLLTFMSWKNWPSQGEVTRSSSTAHDRKDARPSYVIRALLLEYGLNACALVPHMVFIVDFVARGLGQGISAGSQYWVVYGIGATIGPLITGHLADRTGFGPALRVSFVIEAIAVILPAISTSPVALVVSCAVIGGFTPGIVPLVIGRIHELVPHSSAQQRATWGHATTSFALFQAVAAYAFSWLFGRTNGDYYLLFQLGAVAVIGALIVDLVVAGITSRKNSS